eukprot:TRINITY_DN25708_c0_g3_i1.p1 TRINITY_DN25708_c0_g3~~TRINITY_DN25708_c0_g3_i1.p1  ORF type:complete len:617 (-),score=75.67 TRINITY_DN25708_c0_g3_i1:66-1916(-)
MASTEEAPGLEVTSMSPPSDPCPAGPQTSDGQAAVKGGCFGGNGKRRFSLRPRTTEGEVLVSFAVLCIIVAIDIGSGTILAPVVPFYVNSYSEAAELGMGKANAILTVSYFASQFLAVPVFGILSDKFGRRPLLLLSPALSSIGFLMQGLAGSFWQLCAFRFFTGLFSGSRPVAMAYVGDTVPPAKMPKYMSMLATTVSASIFISPILGGSLGLVNLRFPCFFTSIVCFCVFLVAWFHIKEPDRSPRGSGGTTPLPPPPSNWKLWVFMNALVGFFTTSTMMCWTTIFPVRATEDFGMDSNKVGLIMGTSGLLIGIIQFSVFVPLCRRTTLPIIGAIGSVLISSVAWLPLSKDDTFVVWIVSSYLMNAAIALIVPGLSIVANQLAPPSSRGAVLAFTVSSQSTARVLGTVLGGVLLDVADWSPHAFMGCMTFGAICCQLCLATKIKRQGNPKSSKSDETDKQVCDPERGNSDPPREHSDVASQHEAELYQARVNAQSLRDRLIETAETLRKRRTHLTTFGVLEEHSPPTELPITLEQRHSIGEWLSDMLVAHNYIHWTSHADNVKVVLRNAFPPIRQSPEIDRLEDLTYVLESHLQLGRLWEQDEFHLDMTSAVIFV